GLHVGADRRTLRLERLARGRGDEVTSGQRPDPETERGHLPDRRLQAVLRLLLLRRGEAFRRDLPVARLRQRRQHRVLRAAEVGRRLHLRDERVEAAVDRDERGRGRRVARSGDGRRGGGRRGGGRDGPRRGGRRRGGRDGGRRRQRPDLEGSDVALSGGAGDTALV